MGTVYLLYSLYINRHLSDIYTTDNIEDTLKKEGSFVKNIPFGESIISIYQYNEKEIIYVPIQSVRKQIIISKTEQDKLTNTVEQSLSSQKKHISAQERLIKINTEELILQKDRLSELVNIKNSFTYKRELIKARIESEEKSVEFNRKHIKEYPSKIKKIKKEREISIDKINEERLKNTWAMKRYSPLEWQFFWKQVTKSKYKEAEKFHQNCQKGLSKNLEKIESYKSDLETLYTDSLGIEKNITDFESKIKILKQQNENIYGDIENTKNTITRNKKDFFSTQLQSTADSLGQGWKCDLYEFKNEFCLMSKTIYCIEQNPSFTEKKALIREIKKSADISLSEIRAKKRCDKSFTTQAEQQELILKQVKKSVSDKARNNFIYQKDDSIIFDISYNQIPSDTTYLSSIYISSLWGFISYVILSFICFIYSRLLLAIADWKKKGKKEMLQIIGTHRKTMRQGAAIFIITISICCIFQSGILPSLWDNVVVLFENHTDSTKTKENIFRIIANILWKIMIEVGNFLKELNSVFSSLIAERFYEFSEGQTGNRLLVYGDYDLTKIFNSRSPIQNILFPVFYIIAFSLIYFIGKPILKITLTLTRPVALVIYELLLGNNKMTSSQNKSIQYRVIRFIAIMFGLVKEPDTSYGSARIAKKSEMREVINKKHKGLLIDGEKGRLTIDQSNSHLMVIAPTGQGKTTRYILPNLLSTTSESEQSFVVTDVKGEIFKIAHKHLQECGYECRVIHFGGDTSHHYNPLKRAKTDEDIAMIGETIVSIGVKGSAENAQFWNNSASGLIIGLIQVLKNYLPFDPDSDDGIVTVASIQKRTDLTEEQIQEKIAENEHYCTFENLLKLLKNLTHRKEEVKQFIEDYAPNEKVEDSIFSLIYAPDEQAGGFISTALASLKGINYSKAGKLTAKDTINFEDLRSLDKKVALFVRTDALNPENYKFIQTLLYKQIFDYCNTTGNEAQNENLEQRSIQFLLDEFGNLGRLPNFQNLTSVIRSAGCSLSVIIQDYNQLQETYGKDGSNIIFTNLNNKILLGGVSNTELLKIFSTLLGKQTISKPSRDGEKTGEKMARDLRTPDELRTLPEGKGIMISGNELAMEIYMSAYYKHKQYNARANEEAPTYSEQVMGYDVNATTPYEIVIRELEE